MADSYTRELGLAVRAGGQAISAERAKAQSAVDSRYAWQLATFTDKEKFWRAFNEYRSSLENPSTPLSYPAEWLLDIFNGGRTDSGIRVSEMTALQVGTVLACINICSNGVAGLPLNVYEKVVRQERLGKKLAHQHNLYDVLGTEPNPEMTRFTWLKTAMVHGMLWGNSYSEIQRDNGNQIVGIWPRNPSRTRPIRTLRPIKIEGDILPAGTLIYETTESLMDNEPPTATDNPDNMNLGRRRLILAEDMLHVPGLSLDGRLGQGTVYLSRQIIGLSLATEKYAAKFFGNGARPAGILEYPAKMDELAIENLRRSWAEAHGGENSHKTGVLEAGVKYIKVGSTPEEGQMLQTRQFLRGEIASIFSVPPHMIGDLEKSARSNVEQGSIEFVLYCLGPWLKAFEEEFLRKLFPKVGRTSNKYFAKFDTRRLMYPDSDSRAMFYTSGKQNGYLSANDIRELEDMNPIDPAQGGDVYTVQVNMQNAKNLLLPPPQLMLPAGPAQPPNKPGMPGKQPAQSQGKQKTPAAKPAAGKKASTKKRAYIDGYHRMFRSAFLDIHESEQPLKDVMFTLAERIFEDRGEDVDAAVLVASAYLHTVRDRHNTWATLYEERASESTIVEEFADIELSRAIDYFEGFVRGLYDENATKQGTAGGLLVMRHGCTPDNDEKVFRGWSDVDIDDTGKEQAEAAARFIQGMKGAPITKIICSDLRRAKSTATLVSSILGAPVTYDSDFRTWNVGQFTGKPVDSFQEMLQHYIDNPDDIVPGGEAFSTFKDRITRAFDHADSENESNGPVLVITHRSAILTRADDKLDEGHDTASRVGPGGVALLSLRKNKLAVMWGKKPAQAEVGS